MREADVGRDAKKDAHTWSQDMRFLKPGSGLWTRIRIFEPGSNILIALILFPTLTFVDVSILKVAISQLSLFNFSISSFNLSSLNKVSGGNIFL